MALLIDERPEEVTDFLRTFHGTAAQRDGDEPFDKPWKPEQLELFASSNDHDVARHVDISIKTIERAKALVENGKHVFIVLDSLHATRPSVQPFWKTRQLWSHHVGWD